MDIVYLCDYTQYTEIVARWIFEEFVKSIRPEVTFDMVLNRVKERNKYDIPVTLIVLEGDLCLGTVSLFNNDLKNRPNLEPWLASLIVNKEFRNRGIGKLLVDEIIKIAKNRDYKQLYLRTEKAVDYYKKLGWDYIEETFDDNIGQSTHVFIKNIID
ncbi:GNAT family N-acetyltransferase [Tepidibacter sp. Z1-5]|uniref:GNAT family N-acetyltransferase n=1 Tax=Tepidibacter sp. Z1-5 TaxID=3134138 RepID=UPI0030C1EEA4